MLKNLDYTAYCADPRTIDVGMSCSNKVHARSFAGDHDQCFR